MAEIAAPTSADQSARARHHSRTRRHAGRQTAPPRWTDQNPIGGPPPWGIPPDTTSTVASLYILFCTNPQHSRTLQEHHPISATFSPQNRPRGVIFSMRIDQTPPPFLHNPPPIRSPPFQNRAYYTIVGTMALYLTPARGPAMPTGTPPVLDLSVRAAAASRTLDLLVKHGLEVKFDPADCEIAGKEVIAYAENPAAASKAMTDKRMGKMTPAALRAIDNQLKQFSHNIVESAAQVRTFVTNKLLEETENPDPRIRIKALELLGKISDVGLFADKTEVTVTHQTTADLRESLREKLTRLTNPDMVLDAEIVEETELTPEALDSAWDDE